MQPPRALTMSAVLALWLAGCSLTREPAPRAAEAGAGSPGRPPADIVTLATGPREPRGSERWRVRRWAPSDRLAAFTTRVGGPPGTRVGLKVSTTQRRYVVRVYRIGAYRGGTGRPVWRSGPRPGRQQPGPVLSPVATRTVVAPWRRDLTLDTSGWEPGFHVLTLRATGGWETQVPYVVTTPSAAGTVALVAPVTTWQAYNGWGGYSLYAGPSGDRRSHAVSFDRPYDGTTGANDYRTAAVPVVVRAERTGVPLSYFTNVDLHRRPGLLTGALGYVAMGHDEYWTPTMRRAVLAARDRGTNLAFLSANTMYWRVRLAARATGPARLVVGYRHDAHLDPRYARGSASATALFRAPPVPRPEHDLVGMQYECYPVDADLVVVSPRWWGYARTGVRLGDRVHGLIGPEADRVYPDARLPRPLQVLGHTPYSCRGVPTSAQSVYYTTPSGAGVFAAGTLRWGCALVDACERPLGRATARFVRVVTGNLLRAFATGPVGRARPARDNVEQFALPVVNSVDAS